MGIFPISYIPIWLYLQWRRRLLEKRNAFGRWENLVEPRQFFIIETHACGLRVCAYLFGGGCPGDHAGNGVLLFKPRDGGLNLRDPQIGAEFAVGIELFPVGLREYLRFGV